MASVTKSFTSTLIGIAIGRGHITGVEQPVLELFPGRSVASVDARKRAMTLEDLLTMSSGLDCDAGNNEITLIRMRMSPDWVQFMLDLPMRDDPGSRFEYCSGGSYLLAAIVGESTGKSALEFGRQHLFGPLGIADVSWPVDPQGVHNHGWGDLYVGPHDMAKLGLLYLHGGLWDGEQLLPVGWVEAVTRKHVSFFLRRLLRQDFDGYGYQWWIGSSGFYAARGRGGQRIYVIPGLDMVIVFTGADESSGADAKRSELVRSFIAPAARSVGPLPANGDGMARLESRTRPAAAAPQIEAGSPPSLPELAQRVSGRSYLFDSNPSGVLGFSLTFDRPREALFRLSLFSAIAGTDEIEARIGLDGVARISPGRFGLPAALKGSWETQNSFVIDLDEIANISHWRLRIVFQDEKVAFTMQDVTGLGGVTLEGRPADLPPGEVDEDGR
jgi:CubicO group peptidase (beta-lactamase class C family)